MQASTVQQLPSTELCLRIVWLSDGPAPRRWSPVKVSMELWARHMGRHCVVDKIVTFWGAEFPFFSGYLALVLPVIITPRPKPRILKQRTGAGTGVLPPNFFKTGPPATFNHPAKFF